MPDQRGQAEHDGNDHQNRERYSAHGPPLMGGTGVETSPDSGCSVF
jgi:hypothetical protein